MILCKLILPETKSVQMNEKIGLQKIRALIEDFVLIAHDDFAAQAQIHLRLKEVYDWALKEGNSQATELCKFTQNLLENLNMAVGIEKENTLNNVTKNLEALQDLFPEEAEPSSRKNLPDEIEVVRGLPANVDEKIFSDFLSRQDSRLEEMESCVLALEKSADPSTLRQLQGILHNLKGESAILGLDDVEKICHATEGFIEKAKPNNTDVLLKVLDWLGSTFKSYTSKTIQPEAINSFLKRFEDQNYLSGHEIIEGPTSSALEMDPSILADFIVEALEHLDVSDVHLMDLEVDPHRKESLDAVFRAFHSIKGLAGFLELSTIKTLAHETESLLDKAREALIVLQGELLDCVFESVGMMKTLVGHVKEGHGDRPQDAVISLLLKKIRQANAGEAITKSSKEKTTVIPGSKLGDILIKSGAVEKEIIVQAIALQNESQRHVPLGQILVQHGSVDAQTVTHALREQKQADKENSALTIKETVKVEADRLDRLLDNIGELVIVETMIVQSPELKRKVSPKLLQQLMQLDKITRELQNMGTSLRMVPVRPLFQKMSRLVRDLGKKSGKNVEFVCFGEEIELDKTVVDRIGDPLVHMLRNSVDHGIETNPEDRVRYRKPPIAQVKLSAFQKGGNVCLEIKDDGRGLNRDSILAKAKERGLVKDESNLTDKDIWGFIFEAGFSTASEITEVSGRGVGMDVVKRNIELLRGRIEIHSEKNVGTTFSIWLPLTLAIIDGMVVRVGRERYIFPTLSVVRIVAINPKDITTCVEKGEMLSLNGSLIPLFSLQDFFQIPIKSNDVRLKLAVIVESNHQQTGFIVDELMGQQQTVIKSLGETFKNIPGLTGGTILSDGCVGIILDVDGLLKSMLAEKGKPSKQVTNQDWLPVANETHLTMQN